MGVLMTENSGRLLGLYDEMSAFLTKIKLYSSRGLTDSHKWAMFYNANPWTRTTGWLLTAAIGFNYDMIVLVSKDAVLNMYKCMYNSLLAHTI